MARTESTNARLGSARPNYERIMQTVRKFAKPRRIRPVVEDNGWEIAGSTSKKSRKKVDNA